MSKLEEIGLLQNFDEKLQKTCEDLGLLDPVILLIGLANGKDLTAHSLIYEWILSHEANNGDSPPDDFEWLEFVDMIKESSRFTPVPQATKLQAQRTLAEYQHNKKKSVEITDKSKTVESSPLKRSEIKRFERVFKNEY